MALFDDNIDYDTYDRSVSSNNEQIDTGVLLTDEKNFNYIFDSETPLESVINQLPGYKLKVTYFNKSSGNQEAIEYPDFSLDDLIVEYARIDNLTIYTDGEIDTENLKDYEGTGFILAGLKPTPGDFILTKLYDGRVGLFVIINVGPINYNFNRIFKVTFKFYLFPSKEDLHKININTDKELIADDTLNNTSKEILYDKKRHNLIIEISNLIKMYEITWKERVIKLDNNYTISYYNNENYTYVGDTNLENFILNLFNLTDIKKVSLFNRHQEYSTILDVLIYKEKLKWDFNKKAKTVFIYDKLHYPFLKDFMYNQIDYFIEPTNDEEDDYYIFSKSFYDGLESENKDEVYVKDSLEVGVFNSIFNLSVDEETINNIIKEANDYIKNNDNKELFYRLPLTVYILKYYKFINNYPDHFTY